MAATMRSKTPSPRRPSVLAFMPSMEIAGMMFPSLAIRLAVASSMSVPFVYIMKKISGWRSARSRTPRPWSR
ncbi:MAG: hypothetical protein H6P95_2782 [Candidatus Aminicenantes bacterium]|nr:hypothetical protein [Candidatus Aminicenantes bacterium]